MMKKGWCMAVLWSLLAGCGNKVPGDVIQPGKMESLLYDYHLALSMSNTLPHGETYKKEGYLEYVFRKHEVTGEEFDSSMVWYTRHAEELAVIYRHLQERYKREERQMKAQVARRGNPIDVSMSGDTVNIWQDRTLYWLSVSSLTNKLTFDLKTDTTFKPLDAVELKANFHFLPEKGASGKAVMALNFYFENDSIQGLTRTVTHSGEQRLYVKADSAFTFQSLSGFIYYVNEKDPKASLLVDDIRLIRFHNQEKMADSKGNLGSRLNDSPATPIMEEENTVVQEHLQPVQRMEDAE